MSKNQIKFLVVKFLKQIEKGINKKEWRVNYETKEVSKIFTIPIMFVEKADKKLSILLNPCVDDCNDKEIVIDVLLMPVWDDVCRIIFTNNTWKIYYKNQILNFSVNKLIRILKAQTRNLLYPL